MATSLCIVCLNINIRVIDIKYTYLMDLFLSMTESRIHAEFGRAISTVCQDCHQLMRQCLLFNHIEQNFLMMVQDRAQRAAEEANNDTDTTLSAAMQNLSTTDETKDVSTNTSSTPDTAGVGKVAVEEKQEPNETEDVDNKAKAD